MTFFINVYSTNHRLQQSLIIIMGAYLVAKCYPEVDEKNSKYFVVELRILLLPRLAFIEIPLNSEFIYAKRSQLREKIINK